MDRIEAHIELVEPTRVTAGTGSLVYAVGSYAPPLGKFELLLDGRAAGATLFPLPSTGAETRERFAAIVPVDRTLRAGSYGLSIRSRLRGGEAHSDELARIELEPPREPPRFTLPSEPAAESLVAICLATHEPPLTLFARQIESIRAQSHRRFVCIVSDDASSAEAWSHIEEVVGGDQRFVCFRSDQRLGYYRNFERALELVPVEARLVALSDQDDRWYPDKLETLVAALQRSEALLACSDMRVVDADGRMLAPSYWIDRRPTFDRLASLVLMNTATGASAMFRSDLLADILPFPPNIGHPFHDHWIAAAALGLGEIEYVDRALYDYVQHGANVAGSHVHSDDYRGGLLFALRRFTADPRRRLASSTMHAGTQYLEELARVELFARTLELRLGNRVRPDRAGELRRLARLSTSTHSLLWLLGRSARDLSGASETLGAENQLLKAIVWRRLHDLRSWARGQNSRIGSGT